MDPHRGLGAALAVAALSSLLTACGAEQPTNVPAPVGTRPGSTAPSVPVRAGCPPGDDRYQAELRGVTDDARDSLWGLLFLPEPGLVKAAVETKIVWRMTGSGTFEIRATGPDGTTVEPTWGPDPHGASSWDRPGDEWGTGWNFPIAGCWTIRASRASGASGSVVLRVG